jgi:hypothetical protein
MDNLQDINFSDGNLGHSMLSAIFGENWDNLYTTGPTSSIASLLVDIFQIYNGAVIMATTVIVGYFLWSGAIQTAHEGKTFGKRFSSLWAPLRMAFGAAALAPVFGLSLVQMAVLSVAGAGFYTADSVANVVADYASSGKPLTTFPAFFDSKKDEALLSILQLETCAVYKNKHEAGLGGKFIYPTADDNAILYGEKTLFGMTDNSCGDIQINANYYKIVSYALTDIGAILRPAADQIVADEQADIKYIVQAKARLAKLDVELTDVAQVDTTDETRSILGNFAADVKQKGWIALGSWYYTLSRQTSKFNERVGYSFDATIQDQSGWSDIGSIDTYMIRATKYAQRAGISVSSDNDQDYMQYLASKTLSLIQGGGDPFLKIINLGHYATQAAATLGGAKLATKALGFLGGAKTAIVTSVLDKSVVLNTTVILFLLCVGIGAGWVLPLIPYAIWIFGVCSVLIGILQSVLAAPIWAAAHCLPDGDGMAGNHTKQGYMMVINLALRPVLITIGFVLSYLVLWAMCNLFISGLEAWLVSNAQDTPGIDALNFFLGLIVTLLVTIVCVIFISMRSFGFIFDAADDVLTWIGSGRQLGSDSSGGNRMMGALMMVPRLGGGVAGGLSKATGTAGRGMSISGQTQKLGMSAAQGLSKRSGGIK